MPDKEQFDEYGLPLKPADDEFSGDNHSDDSDEKSLNFDNSEASSEEEDSEGRRKDKSDDDNGEEGVSKKKKGIRWGPLIVLLVMMGPAILPALLSGWTYLSTSQLGLSLGLSWTHEQRLEAFYTKHNPKKIKDVKSTLRKWKGKEEKLFEILEIKYSNADSNNEL